MSDSNLNYTTAISLLNQAEATTWARMTSFLTLCGFLFSTWGLSVSKHEPWAAVAVSVPGAALSAVFWRLMKRSRAFVAFYEQYARGLELNDGPLSQGKLCVDLPSQQTWRSRYVAPLIPAMCGVAFVGFALVALVIQVLER